MTKAWGTVGGKAIQLGLHQLCAIESLNDLQFLIFPVVIEENRQVKWKLDQGLSMVLSEGSTEIVTATRTKVLTIVIEEICMDDGGRK